MGYERNVKYVSKLTNEDIDTFLKDNGYELVQLYDDDGKKIPCIERGANDIFIRCRNIEDNETMKKIKEHMIKRNPMLSYIMHRSSYSQMIDAMMIKDFDITRISVIDFDKSEDPLNKAYVMFMYEKFGDKYLKDYNRYLKTHKDDYNMEK